MPIVNVDIYRRQPRADGKPGYQEAVPIRMGFVESDGTDIRMSRIRAYHPDGRLAHVLLVDPMGVPFCDLPDVPDDLAYLKMIRGGSREKYSHTV